MKKTRFIILSLAVAGLSLTASCKKADTEVNSATEMDEKDIAIQKADQEIKAAEAELEKMQQKVRQAKEEGDIEKARQLRKEMEEDIRSLKQKIIENEDRIREAAATQPVFIKKGSESIENLKPAPARLEESGGQK